MVINIVKVDRETIISQENLEKEADRSINLNTNIYLPKMNIIDFTNCQKFLRSPETHL